MEAQQLTGFQPIRNPGHHTPGPWEFTGNSHAIEIQTQQGDPICLLGAGTPDRPANARLIAAAPKHHANALYLDSIMPDVAGMEPGEVVEIALTVQAVRDIRAAIAAATE